MKYKNLEKAVLLTVMLMSLHGGVEAAAVINNDIDTNKTTTVNSITESDGNEHHVTGSNKLDVTGVVNISKNSSLNFSNPETNVTLSSGKDYSAFQVIAGKLVFGDESKLIIDKTITAKATRNTGIYAASNSEITLGKAGAEITVRGANDNSAGIYAVDSNITSNGNLKITVEKSGANNKAYGIYSDGITTSNFKDVTIVMNEEGGNGTLTGVDLFHEMQSEVSKFTADNLNITIKGGNTSTGVYIESKDSNANETEATVNGKLTLDIEGNNAAYGLRVQNSKLFKANEVDITTTSANTSTGVMVEKNAALEFAGGTITATGTEKSIGISNSGGKATSTGNLQITAGTGITNSSSGTVTVDNLSVDANEGIKNNGSNVTVNEQAVFKNAKYIMRSWTNGTKTEFKKDFITQGDGDNLVMVLNGSTADINSSEAGLVQFTGSLRQDGAAFGNYTDGTININLTTEDSYWNLNDDSTLNALKNNTIVDMTADKGKFSILKVNTLDGNGDIKMDIDADKNTGNSDRLYVDTLNGTQNIILNGINNNESKAAVGTVLASVNSGNGEFKAKDVEGALYWNSFEIDKQTSADGNYKDDWYISDIELNETGGEEGGNTTSVDTILGANALNYHTLRAENDQLMRRMGELRNNGTDEEGAWFRVHGSKINRDDSMSFENKYTTYELGYDQLTKETKDMVRYTGAALSYTDGSSSYDSGNGENHSKALSFYNTDLYRSGHYLDLVFKYANMDNDFSVFDTAGQKITGEYRNTGISVSAEYGRKNELKNGWYVEPQAQLTLGYFGGDEYETSNGISVDQSGIASVLGRVGFNIGRELGNSGVIYAKANLLHEFAGDYDIDMYDGAGNHRAESASFNDTWFEYGVGAALKTGKNNHLYFDFVKTAGGDFEKEWTWNAGMRWTF